MLDDVLFDGEEAYQYGVLAHVTEQGTPRVQKVRFNIVNTSSTKSFDLAIPSRSLEVTDVQDGVYSKTRKADSVHINPLGSAIVDANFDVEGVFDVTNTTASGSKVIGTVTVMKNHILEERK